MRASIAPLAVLALLGLGAPATATAAPVKVADGSLVAATGDGRYLLVASRDANGAQAGPTTVIDRTTSQGWPAATEPGSTFLPQLADHSPRLLLERAGRLVVRDVVAGTEQPVDVGPDGQQVSHGRALLVKDGTTVIFGTKEPNSRILERDLSAGTTTVRMTGAELRDASEDGRVITYLRTLPTERRPAGSPSSGDNFPDGGLEARAIGYQVEGQAPRYVARTTYTQRPDLTNGAACTGRSDNGSDGQPGDLQITQAGDGRYTLVSTVGRLHSPASQIQRLGADGSRGELLGGMFLLGHFLDVTLDRRSTAFMAQGSMSAGAYSQLTADDGTSRPIPSSTDVVRYASSPLVIDRGRTVLLTGLSADGTSLGIFADEGPALGAPQTASVLALPRAGDPIDTPDLRADVSWATCPPAATPAAAGKLRQYASVVVRQRGSSAGRVTVRLAPVGVTAAKQVRLSVRHRGHVVWSRTLTRAKRITLPRIPTRKHGYTLRVRVTLTDGKVLTSTTPPARAVGAARAARHPLPA